MSRHVLQIKYLLEKKKLSKSRFNPESSFRAVNQTVIANPSIKCSDSTSSLKNKGNDQILLIQDRYRKLEQNYRNLLEQTRQKAALSAKHKHHLEKCRLQSQNDKRQIQRLTSMLGLAKKEDQGTQVDMNKQSRTTYDSDSKKFTIGSKARGQTDLEMGKRGQRWNKKSNRRSTKKQSLTKMPYDLMKNKSETTIFYCSPLKEIDKKLKNEKYKFIPRICLLKFS